MRITHDISQTMFRPRNPRTVNRIIYSVLWLPLAVITVAVWIATLAVCAVGNLLIKDDDTTLG